MSTIKANQWLNSDGTENYKCRAWVNFDGTGTVAIRAAGNVTSITDNGVGDYTVNFTTAMSDVNYCTQVTRDGLTAAHYTSGKNSLTAQAVNSTRVYTAVNGTFTDAGSVYVAIFR